jgi:serpin B
LGKKALLTLLAVVLMLSLAACGPTAAGQVVKSDKEREDSPIVSQTDQETFVNGNTDFAFDLYQLVKKKDGNLFYSPYSISLALAMTYAGARGQTEEQMSEAMNFLLQQDRLHPAFNYLDLELSSRGEGAKGKDGEGFQLNIVNAIWGQEDYEFLDEFLDTMAENYGAGIRLLDFISEAEKARITINDWVSENTEGKIEDLIPQGAINALTRLVLTNAIYFNAAWAFPFDESMTRDSAFYLLDGSTVNVPMMHQTESFGYAAGDHYQAVELPYDGGELSMVVILPREGHFGEFESQLNSDLVSGILGELELKNVALAMPKFTFDSKLDLKETLADLGMTDAFVPSQADFSGIDGTRNLVITDVFHKAFVAIDEEGTEAAAATAVVVGLTAAPEEPIEVTLDRPFMFIIRDIETGTILFVGRVMNPMAS